MPYTGFIFCKDKTLRFPKSVMEYQSLLDLPQNFQSKFGKYETLVQLCKFLDAILSQLGLKEHPVRDVMKYELTVQKVKDCENGGTTMEVKEFDHDVEGFIVEINTKGFHRLPEFVRCERYAMLFTKKDEKVVMMRLPAKIAQILSPHLKPQG